MSALKRTTRRTFAAVALLPALLGGGVFWTRSYYKQTLAAAHRAERVIHGIDQLMGAVTEAETSQRGFLLTGKAKYLAPFDGACVRARGALQELRAAAEGGGAHASDLDEIGRLLEGKIAELDGTVSLQRAGRAREAEALVDTDEGESYMRSIRTLAARIAAEEERLLRDRTAAQAKADAAVNTAIVLLTATALGALLWAARSVDRYIRKRDRAERALAEANERLDAKVHEVERLNHELESRVEERTAELTAANENLLRSNNDLQRFAYVASHDLQEPLRMVGSFLGLLAAKYKGRLDQQADDYIHFAVDGAKRLQDLINDLLAYSRAGTQAFHFAETPMSDLVGEAARNLQASIEETGAEIVYHPDMPVVNVDRLKMTQVFQNLIGNAVKFRKPDTPPRVEITAEAADGGWRIAVKDNGVGFDPKYAERIFEIFQRLHAIGRYPGNGIGLAICKRVVEGHGGKLWAESAAGAGATFYLTLPRSLPAERADAAAPAAATV